MWVENQLAVRVGARRGKMEMLSWHELWKCELLVRTSRGLETEVGPVWVGNQVHILYM
jgi:hypothetical protein